MLYLILLLVVASLGLLIAALATANTLWAWISVLISVVAASLLVFDWIQNRRRRSREAPANDHRWSEPVFEEHDQPFVIAMPPPGPPPPMDVAPREQAATSQELAVPSRSQSRDAFLDEFEESFRDFDTPDSRFEAADFGAQSKLAQSNPGQLEFGEPPSGTHQVPDEPPEAVTAIQEPITATQGSAVDPGSEPGEENTDATNVLSISELSDEVVVIDERPRYHLMSCAWLNGRPTLPLPVSEARELGFTPCALCLPDSTLAARQRARS